MGYDFTSQACDVYVGTLHMGLSSGLPSLGGGPLFFPSDYC